MPSPSSSKRRQSQTKELSEHNSHSETQALLDMLEAVTSSSQARRQIHPPVYNGTGDVEFFLSQFREVAQLNRWGTREYALHLQLSLRGKAQDCGELELPLEIEALLRAKFGLKIRQARDKLRTLKESSTQSYRELGTQARQLVQAAYPNWCPRDIEELALETFIQALRSSVARNYLLDSPVGNILEAIEYLSHYEWAVDGHPGKTSGHTADTPVQTKVVRRHREKTIRCFRCKGPHHIQNCKELKESKGNDSRPATQA